LPLGLTYAAAKGAIQLDMPANKPVGGLLRERTTLK
jgi:hypothetical protein